MCNFVNQIVDFMANEFEDGDDGKDSDFKTFLSDNYLMREENTNKYMEIIQELINSILNLLFSIHRLCCVYNLFLSCWKSDIF